MLSTYIYPIEKPILLSKYFNFHIDNPRSEFDIKRVAHLLSHVQRNSTFEIISTEENDFSGAEHYLLRFRDHFEHIDPHIKSVFSDYSSEKILEYVAKNWITFTYEDEGLAQEARDFGQKMEDEGKAGFIMPEEDHPSLINKNNLRNFCSLLSLLYFGEKDNDYYGQIFIMDEYHGSQNDDPWFNFLMFMSYAPHYSVENGLVTPDGDMHFFATAKDDLLEYADFLDKGFNPETEEKLLYIGHLLNVARREMDTKVRILLLTSILELLLTHNPDYNRFNVEDSINKQFQIKISTIMYINDPSIDLDAVKKELKQIYSARSNIAHGNFKSLEKLQEKAQKDKVSDNHYPLENYVSQLYQYVRNVLLAYLRDRNFVDFLKSS